MNKYISYNDIVYIISYNDKILYRYIYQDFGKIFILYTERKKKKMEEENQLFIHKQ